MLKKTIEQDLNKYMKERNTLAVSVLRMVASEIKNLEIEKKGELSDEDVLGVLINQAKRREESAEQFAQGGRRDLSDKEMSELEILKGYLPEQLSGEDLALEIKQAIAKTGANGPKEMGKVMGVLAPKLKGRVGGKQLSEAVRAELEAK